MSAPPNRPSAAIDTFYLISHTHADLGHTDHQSTAARQQLEFIYRSIEPCEEIASYPPMAQFNLRGKLIRRIHR
jgi:hypothetical protein